MGTGIYFCGEVVADLLEHNQGSGDFKLLLGGSLFHGATGAKRAVDREQLDIKVGFVGPLSSDMLGNRFYDILTNMGIDTSGICRVDRNTTLAMVSIRPGMENGFVFYGRSGADEMTRIEDLPVSLGADGEQQIFCCGSISTVMEPARFAWLEFARRQREKALVFYDLNTRPSIAKNPDTYRDIVLDWARTAHVMKASDADIAWAYPGQSMRAIADSWLNEGARMVVFTKGMHGSEAYTRSAFAQAESLDLIAANTIGAGDNFNAGFAMNLARYGYVTPGKLDALTDKDLLTVLQGANTNAAYHLISIGAKPRQQAKA